MSSLTMDSTTSTNNKTTTANKEFSNNNELNDSLIEKNKFNNRNNKNECVDDCDDEGECKNILYINVDTATQSNQVISNKRDEEKEDDLAQILLDLSEINCKGNTNEDDKKKASIFNDFEYWRKSLYVTNSNQKPLLENEALLALIKEDIENNLNATTPNRQYKDQLTDSYYSKKFSLSDEKTLKIIELKNYH